MADGPVRACKQGERVEGLHYPATNDSAVTEAHTQHILQVWNFHFHCNLTTELCCELQSDENRIPIYRGYCKLCNPKLGIIFFAFCLVLISSDTRQPFQRYHHHLIKMKLMITRDNHRRHKHLKGHLVHYIPAFHTRSLIGSFRTTWTGEQNIQYGTNQGTSGKFATTNSQSADSQNSRNTQVSPSMS